MVNILRSPGAVADFAWSRMMAAGLSIERDDETTVPDWFPLHQNLEILAGVGKVFGDPALFDIGFSVREHARFPPEIRSLEGALETLDIAFHANHRRDGRVMYDRVTGQMLEGIGHYGYRRSTDGTLISDSTSVYPCSFDRGIISGLAARFDPAAKVHHPDQPCRTHGATHCVYLVSR